MGTFEPTIVWGTNETGEPMNSDVDAAMITFMAPVPVPIIHVLM